MSTSHRTDAPAEPHHPTVEAPIPGAPDPRPVIAVAGAAGFIGAALAPALGDGFALRGLSRRARAPGAGGYGGWAPCDLFSLMDAEEGLRGARRAVYLVHSMMPSSRLTQGRFEDMDLVCADNFARAARDAGVERIVYLGGLLPPTDDRTLSRHLASRREVEDTLAAYGAPVVTLRAGLVIGPGGSSWHILSRLVRRLPMMICPRWTRTMTQPIALSDIVALLAACALRDDVAPGTYDVGGPDVVSYQEMMRATARAMGVRRPMMPVPLLTVGLSRLWVSAVTGAPKELVAPLIESLEHPMVARDRRLQAQLGLPGRTLGEALADTLAAEEAGEAAVGGEARSTAKPRPPKRERERRQPALVRSVQRMTLPPERDAAWVADEYMRWLPTWLIARVLRVEVDEVDGEQRCRFIAPLSKQPLLELTLSSDRSADDRRLFYITGGSLARGPHRVPSETEGEAQVPPVWRRPEANDDVSTHALGAEGSTRRWRLCFRRPPPEDGAGRGRATAGTGRGRLEFREVLGGAAVIAAIHDYRPRLPWCIYACTQAKVHLMVMRAYGRHLRQAARRAEDSEPAAGPGPAA